MARIDYYKIQQDIQTIIQNETSAKQVTIEEGLVYNADETPWVGIYLNRRDAPSDRQSLSAGRRTTYNVRLSIWVYAFAFQFSLAAKARDDALGEIEVKLMEHRALITEGSMWFEGGDFETAKNEDNNSFLMGAEIIMVVDATSIV